MSLLKDESKVILISNKSNKNRKYVYLILVALLILLVQFILAFSFYSYNYEDTFKTISKLNKFDSNFFQNTLFNDLLTSNSDNFSELPLRYSTVKPKKPPSLFTKVLTREELHRKFYPSTIDFNLSCNLHNSDALFCINRARTQQCKQKIAHVACLSQKKRLYAPRLPKYCPLKGSVKKKNVTFSYKYKAQNVKIVFVLTLNGRADRQVKRLIKNIYSPKHFYYIHVDKRQKYLHNQLLKLEKHPNIRVARDREATIWGGASLLPMFINALKESTQNYPDWDYILNLSESDMIIKPLEWFESFLLDNLGKNFLKFQSGKRSTFIRRQGIDRTFVECENHMWDIGERKLPKGVIIDGGSDWIVLNRKFAEYAVYSSNPLLVGLRTFYKYSLLPLEGYFHVALMNSEFCTTLINSNLRYINWQYPRGCRCGRVSVDWCGCSPINFRPTHLSIIKETWNKPVFFARKFESFVSHTIYDEVENLVFKRNSSNIMNINKYWQNDYHFEDEEVTGDRITFYYILALLTLEKVSSFCKSNFFNLSTFDYQDPFSQLTINDSTTFFESDIYMGFLIHFSYTPKGSKEVYSFETRVNQILYFKQFSTIGPAVRLNNIQVCDDLDPKEFVFKNFACIMGPYSTPTLRHKWRVKNENFTVNAIWLDPTNTLAGSFDLNITYLTDKIIDDELVFHHEPQFNFPLRPGLWRCILFYNSTKIAETSFMIIPLIFNQYHKTILKPNEVILHNNGPQDNSYSSINYSELETRLKVNVDFTPFVIAEIQASRHGQDLLKWLFDLVKSSWRIDDICFDNTNNLSCSNIFQKCNLTEWSSMILDPKCDLDL